MRHKIGRGPHLCKKSSHVDDDVQFSALDPFYELDGRKSRDIGEVSRDLKRSELNQLVEIRHVSTPLRGSFQKVIRRS